jgi:RsiW-degrading membrane proteinase PrsW (M82 family)
LILNVALAFVPVLVLLAAFVWLDVLHLLSARAILVLVALGGLAAIFSYPLSGQALDALPLGFSGYSRFVAPWIEEGLKGLAIVWLFVRNKVGYKIDAVLCGLAIGTGFALVENGIYLSQQQMGIGAGVWLVRGSGTAVMHTGTAAIMAALSHHMNERSLLAHLGDWKFHPTAFLPGYIVAVALHTAFNQFPDRPIVAMVATIIVVPFVAIFLYRFGAREASHMLEQEQAEHIADQPALEAGDWPDSMCGRSLRDYVDQRRDLPNFGAQVIEYWRLLGELVLSAESRLVERANGARLDPQAELDRDRFARLAAIEHEMDHPTLRRIKRLLPFSRNDLWSLEELREQLHRH